MRDSFFLEENLSLRRRVESVYDVKESRFPRTVRTDQTEDLPFLDRIRYVREGCESSESL
jgi:hypothetical protein